MSMPAIKAEATTVAMPTSSPTAAAPVVTMTPKQAPRAEKYAKMAREAAVRIVPPLSPGEGAVPQGTDTPSTAATPVSRTPTRKSE